MGAAIISLLSLVATYTLYADAKREAAIASSPVASFQISGNNWNISLRNYGPSIAQIYHVDFVFPNGEVIPITGEIPQMETISSIRLLISEAIKRVAEEIGPIDFYNEFLETQARTAAPIRLLAAQETIEIFGFDKDFGNKWRDQLNDVMAGISLRACVTDISGRHRISSVEGGLVPLADCPDPTPIIKF